MMKIRIFSVLSFLLLFTCILDPANLLLGIKDILFVLMVLLFFALWNPNYKFPAKMVHFIALFTAIPIISIIIFLLRNFSIPPDYLGFGYLKCYLFLFIVFIFINYNVNVLKMLLLLLNLMAILTLCINFLSFPGSELHAWGDTYVIFSMDFRKYGPVDYAYTYFHTAPLFVISLCYYWWHYLEERGWKNLLLTVLAFLAMLNSGTRGNIFAAFIILFFLPYIRLNIQNKVLFGLIIGSCIVVYLFTSETISSMFSSVDYSNNIKLSFLADYRREIFKFPDFFIGQGLGSEFYATILKRFESITELTYLETIRRYGVILAGLTFLCMFFPVMTTWRNKQLRWLSVSYFVFLLASAFNPFYFSSNGMIILSIVLCISHINQKDNDKKIGERCSA